MRFRVQHSLEKRDRLAQVLRQKYPGFTPVVVEPASEGAPPLAKCKFLCPPDMKGAQLMLKVRSRLPQPVRAWQALYLYCGPVLLGASTELGNLPLADDGLLYIKYAVENTFGGPLAR